jgi:hypothetical protein
MQCFPRYFFDDREILVRMIEFAQVTYVQNTDLILFS